MVGFKMTHPTPKQSQNFLCATMSRSPSIRLRQPSWLADPEIALF